MEPFLLISGVVAGGIDSIAGGGGLITLPTMILVLGPGAQAIGSNKIPAILAAGMALLVYIRAGHFNFKASVAFSAAVALGAAIGSHISPLLPVAAFKWFLAVTCPLILTAVWKKDLWAKTALPQIATSRSVSGKLLPVLLAGLCCGIYDGMWGPGAGTFMFLSLLFFAKQDLFEALAAAKLANTCSAATALTSYSLGGFVHWHEGWVLGIGTLIGAYFGATHATKKAAQIVRPTLAVVVLLLLTKLFLS